MADDVLGEPRHLDQRVEVDPGLDAEFLAKEYQVLGADVARRPLERRERTAAEAGDRAVEQVE